MNLIRRTFWFVFFMGIRVFLVRDDNKLSLNCDWLNMFEFIRKHQRWVLGFLLVLILPSFVFFGIENYFNSDNSQNGVAKVGDYTITRDEWDAAQRQQLDRVRQMFGDKFDTSMFNTPAAKRQVLDNLISQYALSDEARNADLAVPASVLQQRIASIPGLQNQDGSFNRDQYLMMLNSQGMTASAFESYVASNIATQQLQSSVQATGFVPTALATIVSNIQDQERTVQELQFKNADFQQQAKVTDDKIKAYYDAHGAAFEVPEHITAQYIILNQSAVASLVTVSDADAEAYYKQNIGRYTTEEQRRARHILISVKPDASQADKDAAKAKAVKLLAELKQHPDQFAALAKANSEDTGSAKQGGDLGYFTARDMVKPFSDAAFALKKGEISDVVQSDFGYHIIQLEDIKPEVVKPFTEVEASIKDEIKQQMENKKFSELAGQLNNLVYEHADSLQAAADQLKLKIMTASDLTRRANPALGTVPYNNQKFLDALFSDEAIKSKHNTEAVEVAPGVLIAGHVEQYTPVTKRPLDAVKGDIMVRVMQEEENRLASAAGADKLAKLKAADDATGFSAQKVVSYANADSVQGPAFSAIMKADVSKLPAYVGVNTPNGYSIYRISNVAQPTKVDAGRRQTELQQIQNIQSQQEMVAYMDFLKAKAKTKILDNSISATN